MRRVRFFVRADVRTRPWGAAARSVRLVAAILTVVLLAQLAPAGWRLPEGLGQSPAAAAPTPPASPPAAVNPAPAVQEVTTPGPTSVTGTIGTDTVWGPTGSPYLLTGLVKVAPGVALTLLPGTVVKLDSQAGLNVEGQLLSLGEPGRTVIFTSTRDDAVGGDSLGDGTATTPAAGDWGSVAFKGGSAGVIDHTEIRFGGYGTGVSNCAGGGEVTAGSNTRLVVSNSTFTDSMWAGVYVLDADTAVGVYDSTFARSRCGIHQTEGHLDAIGNVFDGSITTHALFSNGADQLRFWFNTVGARAEVIDPSGIGRDRADVRYNRFTAAVNIWGTASQRLSDWSGNWWGHDANTALPECANSTEAAGYYPPLSLASDPVCAESGRKKVLGYAFTATPALSAAPQHVPGSLIEAAAPTYGPVDTYRGRLSYQASDLSINDAGKRLAATRSYRSDRTGTGDAGAGWSSAYSESVDNDGNGTATLKLSGGGELPFVTDPAAGYAAAPGVSAGYSTGAAGTTITTPGQTGYQFNASGELTGLTLGDPGHRIEVQRADGHVSKVTGLSGRHIDFGREGGKLRSVADGTGRSVTLGYTDDGRLASATGVDGGVERYEYDSAGRLTKVTSPGGRVTLAAGYDAQGRVVWLEQGGNGRTTFAYGERSTTLTLPDGRVIDQVFDGRGRLVSEQVRGAGGRHVVYDAEGRVAANVGGVPSTPMTGYSAGANLTFHDANGDPVLTTDPTTRDTRTTFDSRHRPLVTTQPGGATITRTYTAEGRLSTVVDPVGKTWRYTVNDRGQLTRQTDPLGRVRTIEYAANGDPASSRDETGAETRYGHDAHGWPTTHTDPLGNVTATAYTSWGVPASVTSPAGRTASTEYNADRQPAARTDAASAVTRYTYDADGRPTATVDPAGGQSSVSYDAAGRITETTDPAGRSTRRTYNAAGQVAEVTDPAGNVTRYAYDPAGRMIRQTDALGQVTQTVYDRAGRIIAVSTPDGATVHYGYDAAGRSNLFTDGRGKKWSVGYDAAGRQTSTTNPLQGSATTAYDDAGRVSSTIDELGNATSVAYSDTNRSVTVTDSLGLVSKTTRDAAGRVVAEADGEGRTTRYGYDADGNVTTVTDPAGAVTTYAYNNAGRMTSATDPLGRRTSYGYDVLGRLTTRAHPDTTGDSYDYDAVGNVTRHTDRTGAAWSYSYDVLDNVTGVTDPAGNASSATYDALSRRNSATDPTGVRETYGYDPVGNLAVRADATGASWVTTFDATGNPVSTVDPDGVTTNYEYDAAGNPLAQAATGPAYRQGYRFTYTHNAAGQLVQRQDPAKVSYAYDARGRLTRVTDALGNATTYRYDLADNPTGRTRPSGGTDSWGYDGAGRIASATNGVGATARYGYDDAGQLTTLTLPRGGVYSYDYDDAGRMTKETNPLGKATAFGYDAEGRLTTTVHPSGRTVTDSYDGAGRHVRSEAGGQSRTFGYDAAGRLTSANGGGVNTTLSYDSLGRIATASTPLGDTSYGYTAAGRLAARTSPGSGTTAYGYDYLGMVNRVDGAVSTDLPNANPAQPAGDGNGAYTYDAAGRFTGFPKGYYPTSYTYDADGRIATDTQPDPVTGVSQTNSYTYDSAGRLESATTKQNGATVSSRAYTWDADGNRTSVRETGDIAAHQPATSTAACVASMGPDRAFDGTIAGQYDRWCSTATTKWLQVDLGSTRSLATVRLHHSGSGGEKRSLNTRDFDLLVSDDGTNWTTVAQVRGNTQDVTSHALPAGTTGRYVRINIIKANQAQNTWGLVYQFEVIPTSDDDGGASIATLDKAATGSAPCAASQGPEKAVNATVAADADDKWCSAEASPWLRVDLGSTRSVTSFTLAHAGAGGENTSLNTRDYDLQVSTDGETWTTVKQVRGNTESVVTHDLTAAVQARYVRVTVIAASQTTDTTARIYRLAAYATGADQVTFSYNAAGQVTGSSDGTGYQLDADGQVTGSTAPGVSATSYSYTPWGELIGAVTPNGSVAYTRDGLGRITTRTVGADTDTLAYDATTDDLAALRAAGGAVTGYQRTPDNALIGQVTTGQTGLFAARTLHGDLAALVHLAGRTAVHKAGYDPFGARTASGAYSSVLGYQSQYTDPVTGLVDMNFRHYNPGTGQFLSADTIIGDVTNPTTFNRFLYGNADPINHSDPTGHWPDWVDEGKRRLERAVQQTVDYVQNKYEQGKQYVSEKVDEFTQAAGEAWDSTSSAVSQAWSDTKAAASEAWDSVSEYTKDWTLSDIGHTALDVVGLIPVVGEAADLINALWYLAEGNYVDAAISAASAIPLAGYGATAVKVGRKTYKALDGTTPAGRAAGSTAGSTASTAATSSRKAASAAPGKAGPSPSGKPAPTRSEPAGGGRSNNRADSCGATPRHSFDPDTPVVMADGTTKPIKDVKLGETVLATDPATGKTEARTVTALHRNIDSDLTDVAVTTSDGRTEVIHTTQHHPFWNDTTQKWEYAADLKPGTELRTTDGTIVRVTAVRNFTGSKEMRDLTVDAIHTYYVLAAGTPVLVHNVNPDSCPISMDEAVSRGSAHVGGEGRIVASGSGGWQFIRHSTNEAGDQVVHIARFDVNPASPHVQRFGPHLNLETQINGRTIRSGPLRDPHTPIDPSTVRAGDIP